MIWLIFLVHSASSCYQEQYFVVYLSLHKFDGRIDLIIYYVRICGPENGLSKRIPLSLVYS